jgi:hypothetical protein
MMGEHTRNMQSIPNSYNKYIQQVHQVGFLSFIEERCTVSLTSNIIMFLGKRTDYDADMHIEIPHVRLGIIAKMLLLNEQRRCTDKMIT